MDECLIFETVFALWYSPKDYNTYASAGARALPRCFMIVGYNGSEDDDDGDCDDNEEEEEKVDGDYDDDDDDYGASQLRVRKPGEHNAASSSCAFSKALCRHTWFHHGWAHMSVQCNI